MKLQRLSVGKRKGKPYWKWVLQLPPSLIDHLGWKPGDELVWFLEGDSIRIAQVQQRTRERKGKED